MREYVRVVAPKHTIEHMYGSGIAVAARKVVHWLSENSIYDWNLVDELSGKYDTVQVYYFTNEADAMMFLLRWG